MSFHEISLPARLAFGSTGGVERRTEVVTLGSGFERRSTPWAQGRRRWLIGASLKSLADMAELVDFFEARRGRLIGFRFRDFMDFRSCAPGGTPAATDQAIGTGDGVRTQFQLMKGGRVVAKPVAGSVVVAVGGDVVSAEVEASTGVVTLAAAPAAGVAVTAGFLFDVPVRFDADRIDVTLESFDAGRMAAVPLVEIRV